MESHVTAVSVLCIGLSLLVILIGGFVFTLLAGIGYLASDEEASIILPTIGVIVGVFLLVLSVPGIIGGWGLLKHKEWARILVLVLSAIHLLNFPIGTAIGVYSIWVLVQHETIKLFNPTGTVLPAQS